MMHSLHTPFFTYIESRIQKANSLYGRFHLGSFPAGQALGIGNLLRRTLLAEIPSYIISYVQIRGVQHEFAAIPGIQEDAQKILSNLRNLRIIIRSPQLIDEDNSIVKYNLQISQNVETIIGHIQFSGPGEIRARDICLPTYCAVVDPNHYIATSNLSGTFHASIGMNYSDPIYSSDISPDYEENITGRLRVTSSPRPILRVNFSIHSLTTSAGREYLEFEILTDGTYEPRVVLEYALEKCTRLLYDFTRIPRE